MTASAWMPLEERFLREFALKVVLEWLRRQEEAAPIPSEAAEWGWCCSCHQTENEASRREHRRTQLHVATVFGTTRPVLSAARRLYQHDQGETRRAS